MTAQPLPRHSVPWPAPGTDPTLARLPCDPPAEAGVSHAFGIPGDFPRRCQGVDEYLGLELHTLSLSREPSAAAGAGGEARA